MTRHLFATSFAVLAVFCIGVPTPVSADTCLPAQCLLASVPYVRQAKNYCGPAALSMVMKYWLVDTSQEEIGKSIFDSRIKATNGAEMIIYARKHGLSSYSWTGSLDDLKAKLTVGVPVIVLQSMSQSDNSGHYRVATGFDDKTGTIIVNDPYDPSNKQMPCEQFCKLWGRKGNWCMLACPPAQDTFADALDKHNPLVHINLAYTYFDLGDTKSAEEECRATLAIEPNNCIAQDIMRRIPKPADTQAKAESVSHTLSM